MSGCEKIESTLHSSIVEHLNAEICLRTIPTPEKGITWLQHTFLYVRLLRDPQSYSLMRAANQVGPAWCLHGMHGWPCPHCLQEGESRQTGEWGCVR